MKIHNETGFELNVRFKQPQQNDAADLTTALLKPGDVIDDSESAFEVSNFSGGTRKALMALTVGNKYMKHLFCLTCLLSLHG